MDSISDREYAQLRTDLARIESMVRDGFDQMNGRVRSTETRVAVLEDRGHRSGGVWGGAVASLIIGVKLAWDYFGK